MNKETRSFIWGLILLLLCGFALALQINHIMNENPTDWTDGILMIFTILGFLSGGFRVFNSID
jgi:hypothetical protein